MTVENKLEDMTEAKEMVKTDLKKEFGCDSVEIGEDTIVLNWKRSVDKPGENTDSLSEELRKVAEKNPNAQVQAFADSERFTVQVQVN